MKNKYTFSAVSGISQRKLSLMLDVGFSQFSMYESGLRLLPSKANRLLIEMETLFYEDNPIVTLNSVQEEGMEVHLKAIKKQLEDNLHEQYGLSREITLAEEKLNKKITTLNFLKKLEIKQGKSESGETNLTELLAGQTAYKLKKENWSKLRQMQLKLEVLRCEEQLLREELGEVRE